MKTCPCCHGTGEIADPIETTAKEIRQWCAENSAGPFFDDEIRQVDAARYLSRTQKTFQNHYQIPQQKHRGQTYYYILHFAEFLIEKGKG